MPRGREIQCSKTVIVTIFPFLDLTWIIVFLLVIVDKIRENMLHPKQYKETTNLGKCQRAVEFEKLSKIFWN